MKIYNLLAKILTPLNITLIVGVVIYFAMALLYKLAGVHISFLPEFNTAGDWLLHGSSIISATVLILLTILVMLEIGPFNDRKTVLFELKLICIAGVASGIVICLNYL